MILVMGGFLFLVVKVGGIKIEKALVYDKHTLRDTYSYGKTVRFFQWDKISAKLDSLTTLEEVATEFGALNNYKNRNGLAPLADSVRKDAYKALVDKYGIKRDQSVPLYRPGNLSVPECYGQDGSLVWILRDTADYVVVVPAFFKGVWLVPSKYVDRLNVRYFRKLIGVDRTQQHVVTLERTDTAWLVRSMNPATTGIRRPPYRRPTPPGVYVVRAKVKQMLFLKDGGKGMGGYAPWATRFSGGAYIHGVPVNYPQKKVYEFAWTLGTTPRSHMCVRNATSHAKFIYDWAPVDSSLVVVFN